MGHGTRSAPTASPAPTFGAWVVATTAACLEQVRRARRRTLHRGRPANGHRLRTALRRLEAALRLCQVTFELPPGARAGRLALVIRITSRLRDHDVDRALLAEQLGASGPEGPLVERWLERLDRRRAPLLAGACRALRSTSTRRCLLWVGRALRRPRWHPFGYRETAAARQALCDEALGHLRAHPGWHGDATDEDAGRRLHGLRLAIKAARQSVLLLAPATGAPLLEVSDLLGEIRDLDRAIRHLPPRLAVARDRLRQRRDDVASRWEAIRTRWLSATGPTAAPIR